MPLNKSEINHILVDELASTNDYLKENFKTLSNNTFISTNFQTKGRGQFKRVWEANKGENVLFSWLIKNDLINAYQVKNHVTNVVVKVLKQYKIKAYFKYPNDIFVGEKKLAGILIETKSNKVKHDYIIVGIGLNVNQAKFNDNKAISMFNLTNIKYDINKIKHEIIEKILEISN